MEKHTETNSPSTVGEHVARHIGIRIIGGPEIGQITDGVIHTHPEWHASLAPIRAQLVASGRIPTDKQMRQGIFRGTAGTPTTDTAQGGE